MSDEIIVNREKIEELGSKMDTLASDLEKRKLTLSFECSKGDTVEHMKSYAKELEKVGSALAVYLRNTAGMLREAAKCFETNLNGERLYGKK